MCMCWDVWGEGGGMASGGGDWRKGRGDLHVWGRGYVGIVFVHVCVWYVHVCLCVWLVCVSAFKWRKLVAKSSVVP